MKNLAKQDRDIFPALPSLIDDFFTRNWLDSSLSNWRSSGATLPAVNIMETNDAFVIEVAAPGMNREDFHVELDNNILTIGSQRETNVEDNSKQGTYSRREFSYQAFQRSFSLPENKVEGEKIEAKYTDGILVVTVPKKEEAKVKPARQIKIS
jgi:HSP20 family protein